jgi:CheY-like chemotaxis protein
MADLLHELQAVRRAQEEILEHLRRNGQPAGAGADDAAAASHADEPTAPPPPPLRTRRRKTAIVIDDDEKTRKAMVAAFEAAEVPVRSVGDGNAALAAIAEEKPDVIVLELGLSGSLAGKDVVNMIKATMEWVDIPILLYTRLDVESQKEARTIHGGDDYVRKGPGAPEQVVAKTITFFRKR